MKIDFHSHILPDMDDGPETVDEALKMLRILKKDGVDIVLATPHLYFHRDSVSTFLERREARAKILFEAIEKKNAETGEEFPRIIIGAEVYFTPALINMPLRELCIENTDYMLLELPYSHFTSSFMNSFANFMNVCEVNVILAHIERYYEYIHSDCVDEIVAYGLTAQGNCDSLLSVKSRARALKMIKENKIQLLGTDLHNLRYRPPNFKDAENLISKKLSRETFDNLMRNAKEILNI